MAPCSLGLVSTGWTVSKALTLAVRHHRQEFHDPHSKHRSGNGREGKIGWKKESGSDGTEEVVEMGRVENKSAEQGRKQCDCVTYREKMLKARPEGRN